MPAFGRNKQIADLLKREIVPIVRDEMHDPRIVGVTIVDVEVSPDLGTARVFYILPNGENSEIDKLLNKAAGFFRTELAKRVELRYTPRVRFLYDRSIERGEKINALLKDSDPKSKGKGDPEL